MRNARDNEERLVSGRNPKSTVVFGVGLDFYDTLSLYSVYLLTTAKSSCKRMRALVASDASDRARSL